MLLSLHYGVGSHNIKDKRDINGKQIILIFIPVEA